ncbi:hypothetical protein PRZ48_006268 [Zasmidium cellare]|uniref:Uncharacterized protein n=1 Tax=Zasmidium cellare TaxID=395010 RepID=A0ABR0EMX5_ZASCE|nr:hypothetical protein PRZ48_006268 [Zasmidium cellare]
MTVDEKALSAPAAGANAPLGPGEQIIDVNHTADVTEKEDSGSDSDDVGTGEKDGKEKKKKKDEGSIKDYMRVFKFCDRLDVILYISSLTASVASGAALPLMTLVFGQFTTDFNNFSSGKSTPDEFRSKVDSFVLWFIYLFVARFALTYFTNVTISIASIRTTRTLRKRFLESTLRQEVWHFDKSDNGSAATQVTTNGNRVNQGISEKLALVVQGISLFFSSFIIALAVQWKLALICMSIVPALLLCIGIIIPIDAKQESRITRFYSQGAVLAQDAISSIRSIHAFGAADKIVAKYEEYLAAAHQEGKKKSPSYGILFSTQNFLVTAATALAFWEGYRMFRSGEIDSVGTVFTVILSVAIGATSMGVILPQQQAIANASSAASELLSIIDKPSLLDPLAPEGIQPPSCEGRIEIHDLQFAYPSRPQAQVLKNLTLSVPAGKTTALVGPSGCGKSTLIGLMERWYQPSSGQILLDGVDISEYNTKWLRSNVRLVQQEPVLFQGTVFENVSKGFVGSQLELSYDQQMELVQDACRQSNAHDFIMELPDGYDTQVGERASMLSGGQRQRVAIARSIISNPKVLLLDEATSALDPTAEKVVQAALSRVSQNKTTLTIAHKLATIRSADNIVVMQQGVVIEQGTHKELIDRDGHYAAMVRAQDLNTQEGEAEIIDEDDDKRLEHAFSLQRTKTDAASTTAEAEIKKLTSGTLGYGLLKCIYIMFKENPNLYWCYIVSFCGCLLGGGMYPAQAILFSRLINVFILPPDEGQSQADFYALMFFVLSLSNFIGYFAIGWTCNVIGQTVTHRYRREMMEHVLSLDPEFFDRRENSSGSLTSKLSSVPTSLMELISANVALMVIVIVNVLASSILAIAYGWKLGLVVVFGGMPVLLGSGYVRIRMDQKLEEDSGKNFADSAGLATEAVTSIKTISSLTLESQIMKEYAQTMDGIVFKSTRGYLITLIPYALSQSLEFLVMALGFWYGSRLIASGEYSTTQFFVVFIAVVFGGQAAAQFFGYSSSITKARLAANYILWLRTLTPKIRETDENKDVGPSGDGPMEMKDVEFRYMQRHASRVLRGISMKIDPGTYAAFVGPSGCGKSTLVSLIERFYDPTSGCITLNGDDIAKMNPKLYRQYMSMVQQEPPLFQGSVRENIALGLLYEPSDEEVQEACRQSNALEFVSSLPQGLDTACGSKGGQFSGGQKQRIAVARALIRKPRLLLLDEATSALDTQSERIVQKALDEAASSRTTIAVAHRLSTIRHASVIFVVANGRIVEQGTHEELQALRGRYYAMCLAQSLDQA